LRIKSQLFKSLIWPSRLWRSTDVHRRAHDGPVDRTVDRQRVAALWKRPRSTGQSTGREHSSLYPCHGRPAGRPLAQRSEIWPLASRPGGRPTGQPSSQRL